MTLQTRLVAYTVYCVAVAVANADVLLRWFEFSRADSSASHLVLIPFVSAWLIYDGRDRIFKDVATNWPLALAPAGLAVVLFLVGGTGGQPEVQSLIAQTAAVCLSWLAGFMLFFGGASTRAALFPLGFLVFMIPVAPPVLNAAVAVLKVGSTHATDALFALTATPYHRDGFVFTLPSLTIEVADECSGIRSSIALLLTSLLAGHLYLRSAWSRALLVAVVLPVAVLKNGIRIASLSLLSIHVNPSFIEGRLHTDGGVVFFLLSLAILAPVLFALRRAERHLPQPAVLA